MAAQSATASSLATFPNQQAIIEYYNGHPGAQICLTNEKITNRFPDGNQKVANLFAEKTMLRDEIEKKVETVFVEEDPKLAEIQTALQKLIISCEKTDEKGGEKPSDFTEKMKTILENSKKLDPLTRVVVALHSSILVDLLDKAWFTPPPSGQGVWTRHVEDLTN